VVAVIFEVEPQAGRTDDYLNIASQLYPILENIDGFISIERFQSLAQPGKILSLSLWRDEEAVREWRNVAEHRQAQQDGRNGIFFDYRLRIANVIREYGMRDRDQAPEDSKALHL
jgi:heme-degrading monooxygenase HmoA